MIPIQLELEGIFSYKEKQIVDFRRLTDAGLFGIFGAVGSGKSSILEAMMLALFGEPDRLSMRNERAGLIHLQSSELSVAFEFQSGVRDELFRCVFEMKRKKKNPEEVETPVRRFYKMESGQWIPLDVSDASEILGMSKDDFRRTIIIPQGKFREFVELKKADRTDMLRDLFGLQKFDLSAQTKSLFYQANTEHQFLSGEISSVAQITPAAIQSVEEEYASNIKLIGEIEQRLQAARAAFKAQEELKRQYELWTAKRKELETLHLRLDEMTVLKRELEVFIKLAIDVFPLIKNKQQWHEEKHLAEQRLLELETLCIHTQKQLDVLKPQFELLEQEQKKREEKTDRIRLLERLIQRNASAYEWRELEEKCKDDVQRLEELNKKKLFAQSKKNEAITTLAEKKDSVRLVEQVLPDLRVAVRRFGDLISDIEKWKQVEVKVLADKQAGLTRIQELLQASQLSSVETLETAVETSPAEIEALEKQLSVLREREGLSAFSHLVKDGAPCPLCGSNHHPEVLAGVANEMHALMEKLEVLRTRRAELSKILEDINKEKNQLDSRDRELERIKEDVERLQQEQKDYLQQWALLTWSSYEEAKNALQHLESERGVLKQVQENFAQWDAQEKEINTDYEALKNKLESVQSELAGLQALVVNYNKEFESIKEDWWMRYLDKPADEIRGDIDKVKKYLHENEQKFQRIQAEMAQLQEQLIKDKAMQETKKSRVEELKQMLAEQEIVLVQKLDALNISVEKAVELMSREFELEKQQRIVNDYFRTLEQLELEIHQLAQNKEVLTFDNTQYEIILSSTQELENSLSAENTRKGVLSSQIDQLKAAMQRKTELGEKIERVEKRLSGLRELERLFTGRGFVAFIAQFYLQELCAAANKRFMKLTRNRLSLEVDEENDFYVSDFLNEGKKRSLKTLSGGQTFQASLCLALALSERVKSISQSERSFFFLDEGFGSLDKESLSIVMETIKSLKDENRVVGLISHVEDMKEEMGVYLEVKLNQDRGSLITLKP